MIRPRAGGGVSGQSGVGVERHDDPVVFLGGHRKCGTTLLLNLFDGHPALCVYPHDIKVMYGYHPLFLAPDIDDRGRLQRLERILRVHLAEKLSQKGVFGSFDVEGFWQRLVPRLDSEALAHMPSLLGAMCRALAEGSSPSWILFKETSIEIFAVELLEAFPRGRMIQLVRDPRDNYAALKAGVASYYSRMGEDERHTLASLVHRAGLGMRFATVNRERFGPERYCTVRFEDLVQAPECVMRSLAGFLGIDFHRSMVTPTVLGHPTAGNSFDGEVLPRVSSTNLGRWRERIDEDEARVIEFLLADVMQAFDYHPAFDPRESMRAVADYYRWSNYRYYFSDSLEAPPGPEADTPAEC